MIDDVQGQSTGSIDQYLGMLRRRRWWLLLPMFLCWALVWVVSWFLPATYESQATILVVQPNVSDQYVVPNVTTSLEEQLMSIQQQVLSRPRLQDIITRLHLYQSTFHWFSPADPVDQMRKDIEVIPLMTPAQSSGRLGELTAFQIVYSAPSAQLAQQVANELTTLFLSKHMENQQSASQQTTEFLASQLADAKAQLETQEAKVREFQQKYLGQLPSQAGENVQVMGAMGSQLQGLEQALDRVEQQKLYLQSLLDQYRASATATDGSSTAVTPSLLDKEIKQLQLELADARSHYTDNYPDVIALKDQIEKTKRLKEQLEAEAAAPPKQAGDNSASAGGAADNSDVSASNPQLAMQIMQMTSQIKSNDLQIADYQNQIRAMQAKIQKYQDDLNLAPVREQEFQDISRGYKQSQDNYDDLLKKVADSRLATDLEQQQQGQHFQLIDAPNQPLQPSAPNHLLVSLGGLGFGIFLGIGITLMKELTDVRVRQEKDLEEVVAARVLVGIPRLTTPQEVRRQKLIRIAEGVAMVLITVGIVAGNLVSFIKG
jgi:protein tyrosine kinase modulator